MTEEESIYNDPVWEYVLVSKLQPYLESIKRWWDNYHNLTIRGTGVFPVSYDDLDTPPGLMYRVTNTPVRSPIKNVQAFPFVATAYLQITGVPGGVNKMIERECANGLKIDKFKLIEKHNLPSTYHKGQFIAFVPEDILTGKERLGKYVYLTIGEMEALTHDVIPATAKNKVIQYL